MPNDVGEEDHPESHPEISLGELEEALTDESHPRHAEADRIMDETVRPALKRFSTSLMPKLPNGGFLGIKPPPLSASPVRFEPPHSAFHDSLEASQERTREMMDQVAEAMAEREAEIEAEKAEERKQREADRAESRRQHRVMVVLTAVSVVLTLVATAAAVVTVFVSGS